MKMLFTLAALAAAAIAAPAAAQVAAPETLSRAVRVADLDLENPVHVARLDRRIGRAARAMCDAGPTYGPAAKRQVRHCIIKARTDAAAQRDQAIAAARLSPGTRTASR
jgi:UrcA family protein